MTISEYIEDFKAGIFHARLESKVGKINCHGCGEHKRMSQYIWEPTGDVFPIELEFGLCDRPKCGYHHYPTWRDCLNQGLIVKDFGNNNSIETLPKPKKVKPPFVRQYIGNHFYKEAIEEFRNYTNDTAKSWPIQLLFKMFNSNDVRAILRQYLVAPYQGAYLIYFYADRYGKIIDGKRVQYHPFKLKRFKSEKVPGINFVHSIHKDRMVQGYDHTHSLSLYGIHLVKECNRPIFIVEGEKQAILLSLIYPRILFLSTPAKDCPYIFEDKELSEVFKNRKVVFLPDIGCEDDWQNYSDTLVNMGIDATLSTRLNDHKERFQLNAGDDIADITDHNAIRKFFDLELMILNNPNIEKLVDSMQ